jgi:hypothetical protein
MTAPISVQAWKVDGVLYDDEQAALEAAREKDVTERTEEFINWALQNEEIKAGRSQSHAERIVALFLTWATTSGATNATGH